MNFAEMPLFIVRSTIDQIRLAFAGRYRVRTPNEAVNSLRSEMILQVAELAAFATSQGLAAQNDAHWRHSGAAQDRARLATVRLHVGHSARDKHLCVHSTTECLPYNAYLIKRGSLKIASAAITCSRTDPRIGHSTYRQSQRARVSVWRQTEPSH